MAIHIVRFEHQGAPLWGVLRGSAITPVPGDFATTGAFIKQNTPQQLAALHGNELSLETVRLLSPVTRNQQFVCQGANYRQHMIESGIDPDAMTFNMFFMKASSSIVAADSAIIHPRRSRFVDYEVELGLVLRRDLTTETRVSEANLHEFIAGIVIVNDLSARDIQITEHQFYKGKSFRTFGPVGPYLCLLEAGEMAYLKKLDLRLTVNGEVRQASSTSDLVIGPAATLNELAGVHDFFAGDLVSTGTPAGCALALASPLKQRLAALLPEKIKWKLFFKAQEARRAFYLKPGDVIETSIRSADGVIDLGLQHNQVVAE
jgi:2-keto-4-pentenoate hydratase/2-oxohepta-3-ene-1,7-dioic acid hydratase in catechol pathway